MSVSMYTALRLNILICVYLRKCLNMVYINVYLHMFMYINIYIYYVYVYIYLYVSTIMSIQIYLFQEISPE